MTSSELLAALAFLCLPLSAAKLQPFEAVEPHMGTLFRIKLYAADEAEAQAAFTAAFQRITELDRTFSDYIPDSELNRLVKSAVHKPVKVSSDMLRLLTASQDLSRESDGAFDITVGSVTHLWREARKQGRTPDPASLREAMAHCGYTRLHVSAAEQTVELDEEGMQFDAGAIAKGDAADQALRVLGQRGIQSALVAASGDLAFSEAPPGETGWKIGLDSFDAAQAPFTRVLRLANGAVSTSGPGEQHLDKGGVRYSHILDGRTGKALTKELTVSVIARRGIDADSLATAVSALGVRRGLALIERRTEAAALILSEQSGTRKLTESSRFHQLTQPQ